MKKLTLLFSAFAFAAVVSSCGKGGCYECSQTVGGTETVVDICEGKYTNTVDGTASATVDIPSNQSEKDYADALEAGGYTCEKK